MLHEHNKVQPDLSLDIDCARHRPSPRVQRLQDTRLLLFFEAFSRQFDPHEASNRPIFPPIQAFGRPRSVRQARKSPKPDFYRALCHSILRSTQVQKFESVVSFSLCRNQKPPISRSSVGPATSTKTPVSRRLSALLRWTHIRPGLHPGEISQE